MSIADELKNMQACVEVVEWSRSYESWSSAWAACENPDWLIWLLDKKGVPHSAVTVQAMAECARVRVQAMAERDRVGDQAMAERDRVGDQAWAEYARVVDQARAECAKTISAAFDCPHGQTESKETKPCDA